MTVTIALLILAVMLVCNLPVALAMAVSGGVGLWLYGGWPVLLGILDTAPIATAKGYEIITIPMFILMAEFIIISGVADDMFRAATIWVGRLRGGVAIATVLASAAFGAISGSSTAAAATLSSTSIPAMLKQGYDPKMACGVVAISGTLAMLIPPSIALVLYGIIADVSIGSLLIAGIIPGLLVTMTIILTIAVIVFFEPDAAPYGRPYRIRDKFASLRRTGPVLVLFFAVTGTIYTGIATPTEASALGAFMAMIIAAWERKLNLPNMWIALRGAAQTTCMILFIMMAAQIFGYFFTITRVTNDIVSWVTDLHASNWLVMSIILLGYLILGFFMDQVAILILTVPVILPLILQMNFDPIWFGVLVVVTGEVGMVTPPLGMNVFVVARYTRRPVGEIFRGAMPHVWAHLIVIAILAAFPAITLWLPSTMR